ncbi:Subtilisin-like protease SBT1.6 [Capsicum annuum]|nr:Subtilisin-like protease SBT1.6 [Capsicum annuum]
MGRRCHPLHDVLFLTYTFFLVLTNANTTIGNKQSYIIRVQNDLKPSVFSDVEHWYSSTLRSLSRNIPLKSDTTTDVDQEEFLHVYRTVFHGFSTRLTADEAQELESRHGVLSVLPDLLRQLHTTRSPHFLGLDLLSASPTSNLVTESDFGSNVVIGVLDTGIWPEHPSFHDQGMGPIPSFWKGECTQGQNFTKANCNKKIIGARYFTSGYVAKMGRINSSTDIESPRDTDGHGTHTASTAAGRAVGDASLLGFAKGVAVGIAPKARVAAYKVCWKRGCMDSDILAGFDKAVDDGVNVISVSVGGSAVPYNLDPIAIGSFGAMEKGVFISASAGNEGPRSMTVTNVAPWITTVGASTIDRKFPADLVLGNGKRITGASLYRGDPLHDNFHHLPLVYGGNSSVGLRNGARHSSSFSAATCMPDSLDKESVHGKIVVCDRGGTPRVSKGEIVKDAGGVGVVVTNVAPMGEGLIADAHLIPGLDVTESAGILIHDYINSNDNPTATMTFYETRVGVKPAPVVASFSSRGPSAESFFVLKPDVIAPGVNILAAWPDGVAPTELSSDTRRTQFNIASGTSMSCPHISGLAALLKGAHPYWSPAMIRSALMTTAYTQDQEGNPLLDEKSNNISTTLDMGAGHVDPEKAVEPGLVYDITVDDYLNFLCASNYSGKDIRQISKKQGRCVEKHDHKPWNLNYPAISVVIDSAQLQEAPKVQVTRIVTHVGEAPSTYTVSVTNPKNAMGLGDAIKNENTTSSQNRAKAMIFLRHHLDEVLKIEYLTTKDPLVLWNSLKERETVNDNDMMKKALSTFHTWNVLLQQQYQEKGFKKYTELSSHLFVAEQNNDLFMKNHENRPTGSAPFPEVNNVHAHHARRGKGRGPGRGRGRGRGRGHNDQERNPVPSVNHSSNKKRKDEKREAVTCFRCGRKGHYSRDCRALKNLVDLYQASLKKKEKNLEANFLSKNNIDITCLDVADFYEHPEGKIDHLIGDGSVNMKE